MSEIEDEAYTEAMEEIRRLEELNDRLVEDKNRMTEVAREALKVKAHEIEGLKKDRMVAAIALEIWIGEASAPNTRELITQLRRGSE